MARYIKLKTFINSTGKLSVLNKIPFIVKRIFYLHNISGIRGKHGHKKSKIILIALNNTCHVTIKKNNKKEKFILNSHHNSLLVNPGEWHSLKFFSKKTIVLVLASTSYNKKDYFF